MDIEGISMRVTVGGLELRRAPRILLTYKRRTILSTCEIDIPDPEGTVIGQIAKDQPVDVRFWYRGGGLGVRHHWQGTVEGKGQAQLTERTGPDVVRVYAVGLEKKLLTTRVTEAMFDEPASVVAKRLLAKTGLPVATVRVPEDILPHIVFSDAPVAAAVKQLGQSLERSFGHDLSKHAVWLGEAGLYWSDEDEPGSIPRIASCEMLLTHSPNDDVSKYAEVTSILYPGIRDSQKVRIRDARRGMDVTVRAEEVIHLIREERCNTTTIKYGADYGWG